MIARIHLPGEHRAGDCLRPDPDTEHYLSRVLRLGAGARVIVFDGDGQRCEARIEPDTGQGGSHCTLRIERRVPGLPPPRLSITLIQGLSTAEKMDWTLEKSVELGVMRFIPLQAARSIAQLDDARARRRMRHWTRLAIAACMQSGNDRLPEIQPPTRFEHLAGLLTEGAGHRLVLTPPAQGPGASGAIALSAWCPPAPPEGSPMPVTLLVGPESGLDDAEIGAARDIGFVPVTLGPRVLRTETAALAAVAALQVKFGDF